MMILFFKNKENSSPSVDDREPTHHLENWEWSLDPVFLLECQLGVSIPADEWKQNGKMISLFCVSACWWQLASHMAQVQTQDAALLQAFDTSASPAKGLDPELSQASGSCCPVGQKYRGLRMGAELHPETPGSSQSLILRGGGDMEVKRQTR